MIERHATIEPRFQIQLWHIFVLVTSIAVMAGYQELCTTLQYSNSAKTPPTFDAAHRVTWSAIQGALLASLIVMIVDYVRQKKLPSHPGHWILLLNATLVPVALVAHLILSIQINQYGDDAPGWIYKVNDTVYFVYYLSVAFAWHLLGKRKPIRCWSVVYRIYLVLATLAMFGYLSAVLVGYSTTDGLIFPIQFVILLAIAWCVWDDLLNGEYRDWLHWVGVTVTTFAFLANPIVSLLLSIGAA